MATYYWAVSGYGIEINKKMFEEKKLAKMLDLEEGDLNNEEGIWDQNDLADIVDAICAESYLLYHNTGINDCGEFLLYPSNLPWQFTDEEKKLTQEDIDDEIVKVLFPYLKEKYDKEWIRQNIGVIDLGGES